MKNNSVISHNVTMAPSNELHRRRWMGMIILVFGILGLFLICLSLKNIPGQKKEDMVVQPERSFTPLMIKTTNRMKSSAGWSVNVWTVGKMVRVPGRLTIGCRVGSKLVEDAPPIVTLFFWLIDEHGSVALPKTAIVLKLRKVAMDGGYFEYFIEDNGITKLSKEKFTGMKGSWESVVQNAVMLSPGNYDLNLEIQIKDGASFAFSGLPVWVRDSRSD